MKKLTVILMTALIAFLLSRYYPFDSRKLMLEYIFIVYLSFKFSKLMKIEAFHKTPCLENN
jgi:hypothetical protein